MRIYLINIVILFSIFLSSCNKEKRNSTKLMKGEKWEVKMVSIEGENTQLFGNWNITSDVDIYDSVPRTEWQFAGQDAVFEWQFNDKGKSFYLQYFQLCEECYGDQLDGLDYQAYALTGKYDVKRHGKNKMQFTSSSTIGYPGKTVEIHIQRLK